MSNLPQKNEKPALYNEKSLIGGMKVLLLLLLNSWKYRLISFLVRVFGARFVRAWGVYSTGMEPLLPIILIVMLFSCWRIIGCSFSGDARESQITPDDVIDIASNVKSFIIRDCIGGFEVEGVLDSAFYCQYDTLSGEVTTQAPVIQKSKRGKKRGVDCQEIQSAGNRGSNKGQKVIDSDKVRLVIKKELEGWNPKVTTFKVKKSKGRIFDDLDGVVVIDKRIMLPYMVEFFMEYFYFGIPPTINAAQCYTESYFFQSNLAFKTNNGFGNKNFRTYDGEGWMHDFRDGQHNAWDDSPKDQFIKFSSKWASIRFHSIHLSRCKRYRRLFSYGMDYRKWAYGLKAAGYATDRGYAEKLIDLRSILDIAYLEGAVVRVSEQVGDALPDHQYRVTK